MILRPLLCAALTVWARVRPSRPTRVQNKYTSSACTGVLHFCVLHDSRKAMERAWDVLRLCSSAAVLILIADLLSAPPAGQCPPTAAQPAVSSTVVCTHAYTLALMTSPHHVTAPFMKCGRSGASCASVTPQLPPRLFRHRPPLPQLPAAPPPFRGTPFCAPSSPALDVPGSSTPQIDSRSTPQTP